MLSVFNNEKENDYKVISVNNKKILENVKSNVAFVFTGIIDYNKIKNSIYNWTGDNLVKFYVIDSELLDDFYGINDFNQNVVCILIEDLNQNVIVKDNFRKVSEFVITNVDGKKITTLKDKIDIRRKLMDNNANLFKSMYGKMVVYSRVERFVNPEFEFNEINNNNFIEREFNNLYNEVLKLEYQKAFYTMVEFDIDYGFIKELSDNYEFYFIENDYNSNNDFIKILNDNYKSDILLTMDLVSKIEADNLEEAMLEYYFNSSCPDYTLKDDEDFVKLKSKINVFSNKVCEKYGDFISVYTVNKWKINYDPNRWTIDENTFCFIFEKGILVIYYWNCD